MKKYNAIHNGSTVAGTSLYVTGLPICHECAKAIIQCGIKNVYMDTPPVDNWAESGILAMSMMKEANVKIIMENKE